MAVRFEAQSLFSHKVSSAQIQGVFQLGDTFRQPEFPAPYSVQHPSSGRFAATFSRKGRRGSWPYGIS
ncbi:hypothetical protein CK221_09885 [Mesorhizobium sp. WSM3868]|nr:hypothetical protein CK221_09885 [Mesorhizobium sp. WSM3868]